MAYRKLGPKEKIYGNALEDIERFLRMGRVLRVDQVHMTVDVQWLDYRGGRTQVPILSALTTPRSGIIGMPEINSIVVCGWTKQTNNTGRPVVLGYLPSGILDANKYNLCMPYKIEEDKYRLKRRPIYPGELYLYSSQGSEILMDGSLYLSNKNLNEIILRCRDQAIIQSSLQRYTQCEGIFQWQGKIERLQARAANEDPEIETKPKVEEYQFHDGKRAFYVTHDDSSSTLLDDGEPYVEDRYELLEDGEGRLLATEFNADKNIERIEELPTKGTYKGPMIQIIKGTVVGNDPYSKMEKILNRNGQPYADKMDFYSVPLKPKVFEYWDAIPFKMPMEIMISDQKTSGLEEEQKLASMYRINLPQTKERSGDDREPTKIDIDKSGKLFINIARSGSLDPLGAKRSAEISTDGSVKMGIGKNEDQEQSLIVNTEGGICLFVEGHDNDPAHKHYGSEGNGIALNTLLLSGCENYEMHGGDKKSVIHGGNFYLETRKDDGDLVGMAVNSSNGTKEGRMHFLAEDQIRVQSETETIHIKAEKNIIFEAGESITFNCKKDFIVQALGNISMKALAKMVFSTAANLTLNAMGNLYNTIKGNVENLVSGAYTIDAAFDVNVKTAGALLTLSEASTCIKSTADAAIESLAILNIKAASAINMQADSDINVKTAGAFIVGSDASISLKSNADAVFESLGVLNLKAAGNIIEQGAQIHLNGPGAESGFDPEAAEPALDPEAGVSGEQTLNPLKAEVPVKPF